MPLPADNRYLVRLVGWRCGGRMLVKRESYLKMFTARAATSRIVTAEIADLGHSRQSVGLKAIEFVNEM